MNQTSSVNFWNGNKSPARQSYEVELLQACLTITSNDYGFSELTVDNTDYPDANDEGAVFNRGTDVLVTVAGNTKFENQDKIASTSPLTKGLLGFRLLMVRRESINQFAQISKIEELKKLCFGVANTWADAQMFRQNDCVVFEDGGFEDMFTNLKSGKCDYITLGANEIEAAFSAQVTEQDNIHIEPTTLIFYPFPLVFYFNANKPELSQRVEQGLQRLQNNGQFEALFHKHHGNVVERLSLNKRKIFALNNPALPDSMADFKPSLLGKSVV